MGDPLREQLASLVREIVPANDPVPRWRRIEAEAIRRGFKSTRAFRDWCLARDVPLREENHRDTWVDPSEVDAAVERLPAVAARAKRTVAAEEDEVEKEIALKVKRGAPAPGGRSIR